MGRRLLNDMNTKGILFFILLIAMLTGFISCSKSGTNCITNAGKVVLEKRSVVFFDSIDVEDYVNLFLTQDSVSSVTVESGQNIINGITTEIKDHTLFIRNTNKCNWLRSYDVPIIVHISVNGLAKIKYNGSGNVITTNTLISNNLTVAAWGGCGTIDLALNIQEGYFSLQMGTSDFKLHGHCSICSIYSGDFGPFDCKNLVTGYTFVTNNGSNDCYVQASQYLDATIGSIGNIYYSGAPDTLSTHIKGAGKVIPF
jgi:hypothetical protein